MIDLFRNMIGNINASDDLVLVLSSVFFLFLITEFARFFELLVDFAVGRRK